MRMTTARPDLGVDALRAAAESHRSVGEGANEILAGHGVSIALLAWRGATVAIEQSECVLARTRDLGFVEVERQNIACHAWFLGAAVATRTGPGRTRTSSSSAPCRAAPGSAGRSPRAPG